jgi:DNA-binding transcriptional MerR regulator/GGDEF domain-containing protein
MKVVNNEDIKKFLQDRAVQERVRQRMLESRSRATVSISVAASLSGFTESQLRDWDKKGFLQTDRTTPATEGKGHRQYTPQDLDKLMLMRELVDSGYSLSDVLQNIDAFWKQIDREQVVEQQPSIAATGLERHTVSEAEVKHYPIDMRVDRADEENFWRYFVSQALRLSLLLITEDTPGAIAGLILPLERRELSQPITSPFDITQAGPSLVGWLGASQALFVSFDPSPSFEYPSDFRVEYLPSWDEKICPSPLVIIQRRARPLTITGDEVASIQRILELVYRHVNDWMPHFGYGMRDWVDRATNFWLNPAINDTLLNSLLDMIVELGGQAHGRSRWAFCNLYLPADPTLPKQQRTLTVRAHSKESPARTTWMEISQDRPGLTYRAYQSGQAIYRPRFFSDDALLAYQQYETSTRSGLAIPLSGADGMIAGAVFIASNDIDAFTLADQRALRLLTRMAEELLAAYQGRVFVNEDLSDALANPKVVDASFADFLSEEDLINEYEELLTNILNQEDKKQLEGKQVSFIELDIDNQSSLTLKYGDRAARNLSRDVGLRLQRQMGLQSNPDYRKVYHAGADRYFLKLVGMSLGDARNLAEQLRLLLKGDYRVDIRRAGKPLTSQDLLVLQNVTVRLGAQNFPYLKLKEVLNRYEKHNAVAQVRALNFVNLEQALKIGQNAGGDCIISWDPGVWAYIRWSSDGSA